MVYSYTPTYYSSFQDTITSLCKSILPFSFKNRRLPADSKHHSDSLKWQQDSFHRILNLIGLHKEGMVSEAEVSGFRTHMLDTLIASPADQEPAGVIRDKLLFLQELFYAKCISAEEYHSSKRPLLQRLAVQGAEIDCRDVIVGDPTEDTEEEWSVIELKDRESPVPAEKTKHRTPIKSLIGWRGKGKKEPVNSVKEKETRSILMPDTKSDKGKRKPFRALFHREENDNININININNKDFTPPKSIKKQWGLKWKRSSCDEDESATPYLAPGERSDDVLSAKCTLVASPIGQGPDTKRIKKKIHSDGSSSDFFIDKVLGENIKKELSRIQSELCSTNPNLNFSDDQMEAISTKLPMDKADLNNFFPKSWCDRYGDIVLDVVKKEFKDHVGEITVAREKNGGGGSQRWVAFEDSDENFHPDLFQGANAKPRESGNCFVNNPFRDDQNPFWTLNGN